MLEYRLLKDSSSLHKWKMAHNWCVELMEWIKKPLTRYFILDMESSTENHWTEGQFDGNLYFYYKLTSNKYKYKYENGYRF